MRLAPVASAPQLLPSTCRSSSLLLRRSSVSTATHLSNLNRLLTTTTPTPPPTTTTTTANTTFQLPLFGSNQRAREETMSPRSFRRLLSEPPNPSPRQIISHRWRDLHGSSDWSSLLDPLDHDLRRELVRYGEHVQATYQSFHSNPPSPLVSLPDQTYRLTRHLHATASVALPSWADAKAPRWLSQRSSWIGYVAVCDCPHEIRRLGRRDIVIALRGTATCLEWAENLRSLLVDVPGDNGHVPAKVQCGFWSLFKTRARNGGASLSEAVVNEVRRLIDEYRGEEISITVTGHSLGASLSLLVADELAAEVPEAPPATVFTFGGPRVGNRGFADRLTRRGVKVLRVVNEHDVVTRVPGVLVSEGMDRWLRGDAAGLVPESILDGAATWGYWHVGSELRVDSRTSPYLRPDADPSCCHDLEAYLHLVDGFLGSHCPFRANAKRSIAKLVSLQGANMKKLYTTEDATMEFKSE